MMSQKVISKLVSIFKGDKTTKTYEINKNQLSSQKTTFDDRVPRCGFGNFPRL